MVVVKRGDIVYCDLHGIGCVQRYKRPCVVVSNDIANKYSPVITVLPITSRNKNSLPTHVPITLEIESYIMAEQIISVDKSQVETGYGKCDDMTMQLVNIAVAIQLNYSSTDTLHKNKVLLQRLKEYQKELNELKQELSELKQDKVLTKHKI